MTFLFNGLLAFKAGLLLVGLQIFVLTGCGGNVKPAASVAEVTIAPPDAHTAYLEFPVENEIVFLGKVDNSQANQLSAAMMYPGNNGAVFMGSILAHALVSSSVQAEKKRKRQHSANLVLEDYQPYIDRVSKESITPVSLLLTDKEPAVELKLEESPVAENSWVAEVVPVFYMSQSEKTLTLKSSVSFRQSLAQDNVMSRSQVDYVSDPIMEPDVSDFWLADEGQNFVEYVNFLFSEALRLALSDHFGLLPGASSGVQTIRYVENGIKKVERGTILEEQCQRMLFRTLRGALKSVPSLPAADCQLMNQRGQSH